MVSNVSWASEVVLHLSTRSSWPCIFPRDLDLVKSLLNSGSNHGSQTVDGFTALHLSVFNIHVDVVRVLLEAEPNIVNISTKVGVIALHCCCCQWRCRGHQISFASWRETVRSTSECTDALCGEYGQHQRDQDTRESQYRSFTAESRGSNTLALCQVSENRKAPLFQFAILKDEHQVDKAGAVGTGRALSTSIRR